MGRLVNSPSEPHAAARPGAAGQEDPVDVLQRWQDFGASWRVVSQESGTVTVSLRRCDGGEEVQRLTSADPNLVDWLAGRTSSEDVLP
jgi:hypothetical protein